MTVHIYYTIDRETVYTTTYIAGRKIGSLVFTLAEFDAFRSHTRDISFYYEDPSRSDPFQSDLNDD